MLSKQTAHLKQIAIIEKSQNLVNSEKLHLPREEEKARLRPVLPALCQVATQRGAAARKEARAELLAELGGHAPRYHYLHVNWRKQV